VPPSLLGRRISQVLAAPALVSLLALVVATGAGAASRTTLPAGTGRDGVGVRSLFLYDHTRRNPQTHKPRALPVRVWYPSRRGARGRDVRYMPVAVERAWEQALGIPGGTLNPTVPAIVDAPRRFTGRGPVALKGVLLLLPGYRSADAFQTNQAVELASRGYGVITFDSPGSGLAVQQPGGPVALGAPASIVNEFLGFSQRLRDVGVVLHDLPRLLRGVRGAPIGILGHSLGGAVAAAGMFHYPAFRAGLDFDGSPVGDVVDFGLPKPFAFMLSYAHPPDPWLDTFLLRTRGPHPKVTLPVLHFGFTDLALLTPEIAGNAPVAAQKIEAAAPTGTLHSLAAGRAAVRRVRAFIDSFFGRYLHPR
jgi:dienelactone hydrolase